MKTLHSYILRELAGPFVVSLSLLTFILFMRHFVFLFPKIAGKNLGWQVMSEIIVLSLPFIIALVLPMAVLVAVIMAFGRFSADNEVTALKALGLPAHRLMLSPMAAACLLMTGAIWFNDQVLPETNHRYKSLLMDIAYIKPTVQLREGVIMDDFPGMGLLVNRIEEASGSSKLNLTAPGAPGAADSLKPADLFGIVITQTTDKGTRRTIVADSGMIQTMPNRTDAVLTLYNGEIQEVDAQRAQEFQRLFFDRHRIRLPDVTGALERGRSRRYRSDRELTMGMLQERIAQRLVDLDSLRTAAAVLADSIPEGDSTLAAVEKLFGGPLPAPVAGVTPRKYSSADSSSGSRRRINLDNPRTRLISVLREASYLKRTVSSLQVEWWKKVSIPFASIVFVLLGVPLGIISRKGGAGVSIAISMSVFLVYWVLLIAGETLADRHLISPFWSMWSPNALFLGVGVWLLAVQVRGRRSLALVRGGLGWRSLLKMAGFNGRADDEGTAI
jgi:lipopolysaccharide export system permease protein